MRRILCIALLGLLVGPPAAAADLYSFVDADGVIHFTNVPSDPAYRRSGRLAKDLTPQTTISKPSGCRNRPRQRLPRKLPRLKCP